MKPLEPAALRKTKYDGTGKALSPGCSTCPHFAVGERRHKLESVFRPANKARDAAGFCLWGKHLVLLFQSNKWRKCELVGKQPTGSARWHKIFSYFTAVKEALL